MSAKVFSPPPKALADIMSKDVGFYLHVYNYKFFLVKFQALSPLQQKLTLKGPPTPFDNYISKQSKTRTIIVHRSESLSIEILLRGGEGSGNYVTSSTSLDDMDRRTDSQTKRVIEELSLLRNFF